MRNERLTLQSIQNVKIRKSQGYNMIPSQTEVKYNYRLEEMLRSRPIPTLASDRHLDTIELTSTSIHASRSASNFACV